MQLLGDAAGRVGLELDVKVIGRCAQWWVV